MKPLCSRRTSKSCRGDLGLQKNLIGISGLYFCGNKTLKNNFVHYTTMTTYQDACVSQCRKYVATYKMHVITGTHSYLSSMLFGPFPLKNNVQSSHHDQKENRLGGKTKVFSRSALRPSACCTQETGVFKSPYSLLQAVKVFIRTEQQLSSQY